ncbi:MAG: penicillin-binding protein 2 [Lentisphaeria bacterium]
MRSATNSEGRQSLLRRRVLQGAAMMIIPLLLLVLRLWQVQVRQGPELLRQTQRQCVRPIWDNPVRGRIFAADGQVMADNTSHYDVVFHLAEMRQPGRSRRTRAHVLATAMRLAALMECENPLTAEMLARHIRMTPALPLRVFTDLSELERARLAELMPPIPGVELVARIERRYPFPGVGSQILGVAVWEKPRTIDLNDMYSRSYATDELRGLSGLEAAYDRALAGKPGMRLVRVDTMGYIHDDIGEAQPALDGHDLRLSIDSRAQRVADRALQGYSGALVVVDVHTGGVLAMASAPTYDLSVTDRNHYALLSVDEENLPLLNRAVNGLYTPGSIVKPLVALAALEHGAIEPDEVYDCTGRYLVGNHPIRCTRSYGHGPIDLLEAMTVSCNPYFIHAGIETGIDALNPMYAAAGVGEKSGFDLAERYAGIIPSRDMALRHWRRHWVMIDTAFVSIGQGGIEITPLQAAMFTAALANGGKLLRPYLVQSVVSADGKVVNNTPVVIRHRLPASPEHLQLVQRGMENTVVSDHGSARELRDAGIPLAGKTGTAEVGTRANRHHNTWIICFGPLPEPRYALACVIEKGDSGGRTAAPIAARFFREWLSAGEKVE